MDSPKGVNEKFFQNADLLVCSIYLALNPN